MDPVHFIITAAEQGAPLLDVLSRRLALSRNRAKALLDQHLVFVNQRRVWMARHRLSARDTIEVLAGAVPPPRVTPDVVLYQDADYVVANKPPGILANGPRSLEEALRGLLATPALSAAHRIDRDTSGCLLYAKTRAALEAADRLFRERRVTKRYEALAAGPWRESERTIAQPIDAQPAVTHLRVLAATPLAAHLEVRIETGRTHQIRKHLAAIGHPVLGDREYGTRARLSPPLRQIERQMLHAARLEFRSPLSDQPIRVHAPLPADFRAWLKRLGLA